MSATEIFGLVVAGFGWLGGIVAFVLIARWVGALPKPKRRDRGRP